MVRALIFDVFGTVVDWRGVSQEKLGPLRQKKEFASTLVNLQTIGVRAINPPCNE